MGTFIGDILESVASLHERENIPTKVRREGEKIIIGVPDERKIIPIDHEYISPGVYVPPLPDYAVKEADALVGCIKQFPRISLIDVRSGTKAYITEIMEF